MTELTPAEIEIAEKIAEAVYACQNLPLSAEYVEANRKLIAIARALCSFGAGYRAGVEDAVKEARNGTYYDISRPGVAARIAALTPPAEPSLRPQPGDNLLSCKGSDGKIWWRKAEASDITHFDQSGKGNHLYTVPAPEDPREEVKRLREALSDTHWALKNLFAMVNGEVPSLLEGDHHYDLCANALEKAAAALELTP